MEAIARKNPSLGSRLIKIVHLALECGSSEPSGVSIDRNIWPNNTDNRWSRFVPIRHPWSRLTAWGSILPLEHPHGREP